MMFCLSAETDKEIFMCDQQTGGARTAEAAGCNCLIDSLTHSNGRMN